MASQRLRRRQELRWVRLTVASLSLQASFALGAAAAAENEDLPPAVPRSVDGALEGLDLKAKPAEAAPEFVTRTRPSPAGLHFMPTAVPHAVSVVPVKTPAQVQAAKDALDAAQVRQLNPVRPVDLVKRTAKSKPAKTQKVTSGTHAD